MSLQKLIDFIMTQEPTYVNGDLEIGFYNCGYPSIEVKHKGWKFPSIYKDSPPDIGSGEIDHDYKDKYKRLFINFESFEYPRRIYLSIEVLSEDTIRIRHDDYHQSGMILKRLK